MFTKTYGDAVVARALEAAKGNQNTQIMAYKLSRAQVNTWKEEGKSIDDVFKLLNLDKAGEELLTRLEINTWSVYITRLTGRRPGENAISVLESHYGAAALAKMILTTEPPTGTLRLLAMRLENAMLWRWLGQKKSLDDVFKLLELNGSADKLLTNPVLRTWMAYADTFLNSHPELNAPLLKTLANFFDSKTLSKVLVAGKKDPMTSELVKELETDLSLYSKWVEKKIDGY